MSDNISMHCGDCERESSYAEDRLPVDEDASAVTSAEVRAQQPRQWKIDKEDDAHEQSKKVKREGAAVEDGGASLARAAAPRRA